MTDRITKINGLIHTIMGELLERRVSWKRGVFVTVTKVETTSNLRFTKVFVSVFPEADTHYALETLRHEQGMLEKLLAGRLSTRPLPKLGFALDESHRGLDEIEALLKQIHAE